MHKSEFGTFLVPRKLLESRAPQAFSPQLNSVNEKKKPFVPKIDQLFLILESRIIGTMWAGGKNLLPTVSPAYRNPSGVF
jgi:hypothetical protein